jgi:hypothetical protein
VRDLRIGKHRLDIRFWREVDKTAFEVISGDPKLVERCAIASKAAELRNVCNSVVSSEAAAERSKKRQNRARTVGRA